MSHVAFFNRESHFLCSKSQCALYRGSILTKALQPRFRCVGCSKPSFGLLRKKHMYGILSQRKKIPSCIASSSMKKCHSIVQPNYNKTKIAVLFVLCIFMLIFMYFLLKLATLTSDSIEFSFQIIYFFFIQFSTVLIQFLINMLFL